MTDPSHGPVPVMPIAPGDRERVALRWGELSMTYGRLSDAVDQLSATLATTPARTVVGIRIGNQPAFVVAFLACLAARRPAVLLDTLWTETELAHAASLVPVSLILETDSTPARDASVLLFSAPGWTLDAAGELVDDSALEAPDAGSGLGEAAVVYWSSGSTGRPKPIAVTPAALEHRLACYDRLSKLGVDDRTLCILPLSHCHGIECVALPALAARGELVLVDPLAAEPGRVVESIHRHGVTAFSALPRFYEYLLRANVEPQALATLRYVMSGSAAIDPAVADRFAERYGARIGLGYGLTEVGVICLNQHDRGRVRYDSVGPVIAGVEWRIHAPGEDGVGELWVRSAGCAFAVAEAEGPEPQEDGWLATGDLVRADEDGFLYIVGRRSTFINVNGAKADPHEIEAVIGQLSWVGECAVVGARGPGGAERIVAYVVSRQGEAVAYPEAAVQRHVAESLSLFKVPSLVLLLPALPRTTIGKLAYAELPGADTAIPAAPSLGDRPRDERERAVADLWCEVLALPGVGVKDSFTRLGGTSIQLAELVVRLQERFGCSLTITDLFRYPNVEAQAQALAGGARSPSMSDVSERASKQRGALRASAARDARYRSSPPVDREGTA